MLQRIDLYCPNLRRKVRLQISIPSSKEDGVVFDTLYLLDGQNVFKNSDASFGRSIHLGKYLSIMSKEFDKRICGVAIWNAGSDLGRTNEYCPWALESPQYKGKQDVSMCEKFTKDFLHTIIPYIRSHFPVSKEASHTFLMGSSLGALYASYFGNLHPEIVSAVGLFSNCPFICEGEYYAFLKKHLNRRLRTFLSVGLQEFSDGVYQPDQYVPAAKKLFRYLQKAGVPSKLRIDVHGAHNEESWERQLLPFLTYLYFNDVEAVA